MTTPTVACAWFDRHDEITKFAQMAAVWRLTADRVFTDATIRCEALPPPDWTEEVPVFYRAGKSDGRKIGPSKTLSWREKIRAWDRILSETDGPALLCDVDIAFYGNPFRELGERYEYDVAMCGHNTGAVYFSGSEESRAFMQLWRETTDAMALDAEWYEKWDAKYKGLDQASMGYLRETGQTAGARVVTLPRRFHAIWGSLKKVYNPYIVHYHSLLRRAIFRDMEWDRIPGYVKPYVAAWWQAYREACERGSRERSEN